MTSNHNKMMKKVNKHCRDILPQLKELAKKHLNNGSAMQSSAQSCYENGKENNSFYSIRVNNYLRSLAYSVGILHPDYAKAFNLIGFSGSPRLVSAADYYNLDSCSCAEYMGNGCEDS